MYIGKRILDVIMSSAGLMMLSPILLLIAIIIRIRLGSPIFFKQQRPGWHGKPFTIYKFRTLINKTDADGKFLPDSERMTKLGRFLRAASLDEFPELLNVLKGDMSLVGPRPLLMKYLEFYTPEQARRHEVRPGITGWAQIMGRNAITWEDKFALDLWYVEHSTIWLDVKIILLTVWKVLRREGISQEGQATMTEFRGTQVSYYDKE